MGRLQGGQEEDRGGGERPGRPFLCLSAQLPRPNRVTGLPFIPPPPGEASLQSGSGMELGDWVLALGTLLSVTLPPPQMLSPPWFSMTTSQPVVSSPPT